jgi:uncharacterized protein YecT (DUF1311 family)
MRIMTLLPSIVAILSSIDLAAQTGNKHPIELELDRCLQDSLSQSTAGMRECTYAAMEAWDAEMNKAYTELMNVLPSSSQDTLRQAQRAWVLFRDKQFALNNQVYMEDLKGTMYHVMATNSNMEVVKRRAVELRNMVMVFHNN